MIEYGVRVRAYFYQPNQDLIPPSRVCIPLALLKLEASSRLTEAHWD